MYYEHVLRLGEMKFGHMPPDLSGSSVRFRVSYPVVSAMYQPEVAACATGGLTNSLAIKMSSRGPAGNRTWWMLNPRGK